MYADNVTPATQVIIPYDHYMCHKGEMFNANLLFTVTASSNFTILIRPGTTTSTTELTPINCKMSFMVDQQCEIHLKENNTGSVVGTPFPLGFWNMNRNNTKTLPYEFSYTNNQVGAGDTITSGRIIHMIYDREDSVLNEMRKETELILKFPAGYRQANTIIIENLGASTLTGIFHCEFYQLQV